MRRSLRTDEEGAVLVLVLLFLTLFGLLVAALLAQGDVNFQTSKAVAVHDNKVFGADAGVEYGIQTLRSEENWCPDPGAGLQNLPSITVNSVAVDVTCETKTGSGAGTFGFAIITHSTAADSISADSSATKIVIGAVYNSGGFSLAKPVNVKDGNVFETAPCSGPPSNLNVSPSPTYSWICTTSPIPNPNHALPPLPADVLPAAIPPTSGPGSSCRVLSPGAYRSTNGVSGSTLLKGTVFMHSGVYYLENLGTISLANGSLVGGSPTVVTPSTGAVEQPQTSASACASESSPTTTGVEIILGGNTTLSIGANQKFELYTSKGSGGTDGISLYQVPSAANYGSPIPSGYLSQTVPSGTLMLDVSGSANTEAATHGALFAPEANVSVFSSNATKAALLGGADVNKFNMKSSSSSTGQLIANLTKTPGQRKIVITATAKGVAGATKKVISRAVIEISNDTNPRKAIVRSWWTTTTS